MRNLFVLHTQYNLILAMGLCKTNFKEDYNDIILFTDFELTIELENKIKSNSAKYVIIQGNFRQSNMNAKGKYNKIVSDNKVIKEFCDQTYDRVFVVDDMCIQEIYTLKCSLQKNKNVDLFWLEDGTNAYFDLGVESGGMGANSFKRFIRKMFFTVRFGLGKSYDLGVCMGSHKLLKKGYFTFPELVRKELVAKEHCIITDDAFRLGMEVVYGGETYPFEENALLIAVDKISIYGEHKEEVEQLILEEVNNAKKLGAKVYYKYHPRETDSMKSLSDEIELDRNVALESYLINSGVKTLNVIGIKSTALQTAKKMGYKSVSLIRQVEPEAESIIDFYDKIGIECR